MPNLKSISYDGTDLVLVSSSGTSHTLTKTAVALFITDRGGWPGGKPDAEDDCRLNLQTGIGATMLEKGNIDVDIADDTGLFNYVHVNAA